MKSSLIAVVLACVAGARNGRKKKRAREKTREGRGSASPSRAPVLSCAHLFPSACYAVYRHVPYIFRLLLKRLVGNVLQLAPNPLLINFKVYLQ